MSLQSRFYAYAESERTSEIGRKIMAKLAESEAWVRRSRQMIHNQPLIQLLSVLAIIVPLPLAMCVFWFAFSSAVAAQSLIGLWAAATMTYVTLEIRNVLQDRGNRLQ